MKPLLSIGMIFKNEIRCLERCMKSLDKIRQTIPCELVMADTGSTDGSREIAEKYADILVDFPWIKDFSAARNAVLDRCCGKWYLSIDADEWLDENITGLINFLQNPQNDQFITAAIIIRNLHDPNDCSIYYDLIAPRMMNMASEYRYEGAIHELLKGEKPEITCYVPSVILWHDGYITTLYQDKNGKSKRNLELLDLELKEDPNNLLRIAEALDAAYTPDLKMQYAQHAIECIRNNPSQDKILEGRLYRDCIFSAMVTKSNFLREWYEEAFTRCPDSIYLQVDGYWMAANLAYSHCLWKETVQYGELYFKYLKEFQQNKTTCKYDMRPGPLHFADKGAVENVRNQMADSLRVLGEWKQCEECLLVHDPCTLVYSNIPGWMNVAFRCWEHVDLRNTFRALGALLAQEPAPEDKALSLRRANIRSACYDLFSWVLPDDPDEAKMPHQLPYPLLEEMGEEDVAYGARIMLSEDAEEIAEYAGHIEDWAPFPANLPYHMIRHQAALPQKFYELSATYLDGLASAIASLAGQKNRDLLLSQEFPPEFGKNQLMAYSMLSAMLRSADWEKENDRVLLKLWRRFAEASRKILPAYFNGELLCEEKAELLPGMYGLSWYCIKIWESENQEVYLQWLRKALKLAPTMKSMIQYLMEKVEDSRTRESGLELQMLADKINEILSAYPADDPAVLAIKESPAYQRVKYLLENP